MKNKLLAPYDWFLIVGIIAVNLIYNILADEIDILGSVAGIAGVLCVVLVAKGSILNYLFGLINVSLYAEKPCFVPFNSPINQKLKCYSSFGSYSERSIAASFFVSNLPFARSKY